MSEMFRIVPATILVLVNVSVAVTIIKCVTTGFHCNLLQGQFTMLKLVSQGQSFILFCFALFSVTSQCYFYKGPSFPSLSRLVGRRFGEEQRYYKTQ